MTTSVAVRDYGTEMRRVIDSATSSGAYTSCVVATEIVERLRVEDPELLDGWLRAQATQFIRMAINDRDRSIRTAARHRARPAAFAEAVTTHQAGDSTQLRGWLDVPFTLEDGSRKPLGKLRRDDLLYVAGTYARRTEDNRLMDAFMTALAKKVGTRTVSEHYADHELTTMFDSLRKYGR